MERPIYTHTPETTDLYETVLPVVVSYKILSFVFKKHYPDLTILVIIGFRLKSKEECNLCHYSPFRKGNIFSKSL